MNTFNDIIGYDDIKEHFRLSIRSSKISHAYIINGQKGMGKKLIGNIFAKTLQCIEEKDNPCNQCTSCKQYDSENNPDVVFVKSTKLKSIGVDDIRSQINQDIYIKPYSYKYKIYMIDEAEKLTEQAQNALLKTIEEPPTYGIIILLVNNIFKLLPTILSRCVVINLKPIEDVKIKKYLIENNNIDEVDANIYVAMSQGIIGRAKELALSDDFNKMRKECVSLLIKLNTLSINEILDRASKIDEYKDRIEEYLDIILTWYRDILVLKSTNTNNKLIHKDYYNYLLKASNDLTYNKIGNTIKKIEETKKMILNNVNYQLSMESLLLNIKES
ncbi:DNA polymerase-3 subunit delta' [Natranaerovirga pectinivora]|uniref:DNA polymerase III subunit delta' n=1 Tax=Natranaerovirga pectinivora TaxID=682400 RepID=A0A4R3MF44_9FIRM|nr:DNA polymerase III subunit delta' C-terminal domain-containing protein [Natranaerovirga pectinivora]TCT11683.1 DNA polymerase-3 subunit delta' [Natranaerovirga pectinivora]